MIAWKQKETLMVLVAVLLLGTGTVAAVYLYLTKEESNLEFIVVNGEKLEVDYLMKKCEKKEVDGVEGAALSDIINLTSVENPEEKEYVIRGADGYQKTVEWEDMETGILTKEKWKDSDKEMLRVRFKNKPKAYWVADVVEIEVK